MILVVVTTVSLNLQGIKPLVVYHNRKSPPKPKMQAACTSHPKGLNWQWGPYACSSCTTPMPAEGCMKLPGLHSCFEKCCGLMTTTTLLTMSRSSVNIKTKIVSNSQCQPVTGCLAALQRALEWLVQWWCKQQRQLWRAWPVPTFHGNRVAMPPSLSGAPRLKG